MKIYALCVRMYEGEKFPRARFIFQAESDEQAENEALKWAIYHGLNYRLDVVVRPANQNELVMRIHNEYLINNSSAHYIREETKNGIYKNGYTRRRQASC